MDIIISLISSLYILVIIHKFSVFRSDRCNRWLKTYDRESTVVYKFFAFNRFQSREIFRFSWSILWSLTVTLFFKPLFGQWWRWKTYAKKSCIVHIWGEHATETSLSTDIFSRVSVFTHFRSHRGMNLSRGSLLWMKLRGTSFQFPSAAKESFWFCFDIFFEKSVHKRVQRRIGQEEHFSCHCFIIGLIAEIKIKAYRQMDIYSVKRHTYDNKHSYQPDCGCF